MRLEPGKINAGNPDVIELSKVLNQLPIFDVRPDEAKFRNPNGVGLKLSNFLAIDPDYAGKGMARGSKLDREVFEEFAHDTEKLRKLAAGIRNVANNIDLSNQLYLIPNDEDTLEVKEGAVIYKLHKHRERDHKLVAVKKERFYQREGRLWCEACEFDFEQKYGVLGHKYIECHHRQPLSTYTEISRTTLEDLALVCANCHRMLHRQIDSLTVEGLKALIA